MLDVARTNAETAYPSRGQSPATRVLIVGDSLLFALGLQSILLSAPSNIEVAPTVCDLWEASEKAKELSPDVVVTNRRIDDDVAVAITEMRAVLPSLRVVLVVPVVDAAGLHDAFRLGANGYLSINASADLIRSVVYATEGEMTVWPLTPELLRAEPGSARSLLREDELDLLRLIAQGSTVDGMTQVLHVGKSTVHRRKKDVFRKLNVGTRAQAACVAMKLDLL